MPVVDTMVPEITKQAIEPISEQIARRLLYTLGVANLFKDSLFLITDDLQSSNFEDPEHKKRTQGNRCDVTIVPGYNPLNTAFDAVEAKNLDVSATSNWWTFTDFPVFQDPRAGIELYEIVVPCSVELQFAIRLKSIELADTLNMMLFSRYLVGGSIYDYNEAQFSYGVPDKFILLMHRMYAMQDDIKEAMTFQEYLTIGSNSAISVLANRNRLINGSQELVINRTNTKLLGKLEYDGEKHGTEDYNKKTNRYLIEFKYIYQFSKPALLRMSHPIMVYNKQIEGQYIGKKLDMTYGQPEQVYPIEEMNNSLLNRRNTKINLDISYPEVRYPYYDDWIRTNRMSTTINNQYQPLFTGLLSLDKDPTTQALSLTIDIKNEIFQLLSPEATAEIEKVVVEFSLADDSYELKNDVFRRLGIFDIAIYCDDAMIPFDQFELTTDLVLTVNSTLSISSCYHIVISQIREIRILNHLYVYYILDNPEYYKHFIAEHMQYLIVNDYVRVTTDPFLKEKTVTINRQPLKQAGSVNLKPSSITVANYKITIKH